MIYLFPGFFFFYIVFNSPYKLFINSSLPSCKSSVGESSLGFELFISEPYSSESPFPWGMRSALMACSFEYYFSTMGGPDSSPTITFLYDLDYFISFLYLTGIL